MEVLSLETANGSRNLNYYHSPFQLYEKNKESILSVLENNLYKEEKEEM